MTSPLESLSFVTAGTTALTTLCLSASVTWLVRRAAYRQGWVEKPRPDRWHRRPTARFGGVGILVAFLVSVVVCVPLTSQVIGLLALTILMFGVGLIDDLRGLRPQTKLVTQVAAGVLLYVAGFRFNVGLPWAIDFFVVLFWVVTITNAMNLLDNMDGLAAGVAVIAATYRFLFYYTDGNFEGALLSGIFAAAVGGFLIFNVSPASIFMGDCGSFVIGFLLAALNLTTSQMYAKSLVAILLFPALVLAIPIFDTTLVSVARWVAGRRVSQGGADHSSHRLVAVGLSERQAVFVMHALAAASGAAAYLVYRVGFSYAWFGTAMCALGLILFGIYLSSVKIYPEEHLPAGAGTATPAFTLNTYLPYKRVMLWVIVDVIALALAYYSAFLFRFADTEEWGSQLGVFVRTAPFAIGVLLTAVSAFGVYRSDWQTFSLHEVKRIVAGVTVGAIVLGILLTGPFEQGLGVLLTLSSAWGAAVLALTGSRGVVRALSDGLGPRHAQGEPTLIYGAGAAGELALREIKANTRLGMRPVGFLDDDVLRQRSMVHGVPVLGGLESLEHVAQRLGVTIVVVSTGKIQGDGLARVCRIATTLNLVVYRMSVQFATVESPGPEERADDRAPARNGAAAQA